MHDSVLIAGQPHPLGATLTDEGVNFAVYSLTAHAIDLLLFDGADEEPVASHRLINKSGDVWHGLVVGLGAGQLYGFRVHGPYDPQRGLWHNPHRLIIDPYARALTHSPAASDCRYEGHLEAHLHQTFVLDEDNNYAAAPKCVVLDNGFDWGGDRQLRHPRETLIVYEVHVKGFTAHASSGVAHPGTYLGFIEKIPHLKALGVNAVELLPVHEMYSPGHLTEKGLVDYWGYNSIGFFAPAARYAAGDKPGAAVSEFKQLVRALHQAGIEVILDVVYNHTGEGNGLGPTLCFRGLDNNAYYVTEGPGAHSRHHYRNDAGCGNMLDINHPQVRRLVLDSMRYWVQEMHVDGFRFDLATILGRQNQIFSQDAPFFQALGRDPVLSKTRLIAEPWDVTMYKAGQFPHGWMEWNDRFRDTWRRFLRGDADQLPDLGRRLTGSEDLHRRKNGYPFYSVNYLTCHDGFTLHDLYAYNHKHNAANGEHNQDGADHSHSWNCGQEGVSTKDSVNRLRRQMMKNGFCALFFSLGMPMLLGGDELGRTQQGNNNAYCQDNEISWFDWTLVKRNEGLLRFVRKAIAFRRRYGVFQRRTFLAGEDFSGNGIADVTWFDQNLKTPRWDDSRQRLLMMMLDGHEVGAIDYKVMLIWNGYSKPRSVRLPMLKEDHWYRVVDTAMPSPGDFLREGSEIRLPAGKKLRIKAHSVVVLLDGAALAGK